MWCRAEHVIRESEYFTRIFRCELERHMGAHVAVVDGHTVIWGET